MAGPGVISFTRTEKYSEHVSDELQQMRKDRLFADFKIIVNDESFPCHKLMVSVHSPYLKAILTSDMAELAKQSINLDLIGLDSMKTILDYMYLGQVSFPTQQLMSMIKACDHLKMTPLKVKCEGEVPPTLDTTNVIPWLKLANDLHLGDLKPHCSKLMVSHFSKVSEQHDFLAMSLEEIQDYFADALQSDVKCDHVLQATMRWVTHDTDNRLDHLETLVGQVRLDNCTIDAILAIMEKHGAVIGPQLKLLNLFTTTIRQKLSAQGKQAKQPEHDQVQDTAGQHVVPEAERKTEEKAHKEHTPKANTMTQLFTQEAMQQAKQPEHEPVFSGQAEQPKREPMSFTNVSSPNTNHTLSSDQAKQPVHEPVSFCQANQLVHKSVLAMLKKKPKKTT